MTISALVSDADWKNSNWRETGHLALTTWMTHDPSPRMIIAPDMELIWSSQAAETLGAGSELFRIQGNRLVPLNKQFSDLCAQREQQPCAWALIIGADGQRNMIWTTDIVIDAGRFIGIALSLGNRGCPNVLVNAFGLTPTESKVSGLLLNGNSTKEVAGGLGIAVETVKTHLKHVYEKLEVRTREQFFAKATLFDRN